MGPCKNPFQDNVIPLTGEKGIIFSPVYPRKFIDSITCTWIITVPERHFVKLRIKSFDFRDCSESILTIRDGRSSRSDLLKSFCSISFESLVFSSSRHLWVQFVAVQNRIGASFYAEFEAVNQGSDYLLPNISTILSFHMNGTLTARGEDIVSVKQD